MPAYMIISAKIAERDAFVSGYGKAAAELVAQFGGKYLLRAPGAALLEGNFGEGASVVISEWPDLGRRKTLLELARICRDQEVARWHSGLSGAIGGRRIIRGMIDMERTARIEAHADPK